MKSAHNVAVLMYHHVTEQPGSLAVTARQFENQMRGLVENGWRTLKADEFFAFMAGEPVAPRSLLLTFDDGYLDNWVHAHPVLERYGLNAVLFAVTGLVGEGPIRPHAGQHHVVLPACPSHHQAKVLMFSPERDQVMLRWDELQAMQAAGTFEIHSHTHTHTRWDQISASPSEKVASLRTDLLASRAMLTQRLGAASRHLAGRRVISTPTTWRSRRTAASTASTPPMQEARISQAAIRDTFSGLPCAIAPGAGSGNASGWRRTRSGAPHTTNGRRAATPGTEVRSEPALAADRTDCRLLRTDRSSGLRFGPPGATPRAAHRVTPWAHAAPAPHPAKPGS